MQTVDWHAEFEARLGGSRARAYRAFGYVICADTRLDMVAEMVAIAWRRWRALIDRGADPRKVAGAIIGFSIQDVMRGKTLGGGDSKRDVCHEQVKRRAGLKVYSLSERGRLRETMLERDLVDRKGADPGEMARARLDFEDWQGGLAQLERCCCRYFLAGQGNVATGQAIGENRHTVGDIRRRLATSWRQYGVDAE